jgi:hypothetical protein
MFPHIQENGVYWCEDIETSYRRAWGGGLRRSGTFVEFSKNLIDHLHAWHWEKPAPNPYSLHRCAHSLCFYNNVLVIEKRPCSEPEYVRKGRSTIPDWDPPPTFYQRVLGKLKYWGLLPKRE